MIYVYDVCVDFRQRFLRLLGTTFCRLDYKLGMRSVEMFIFSSVENVWPHAYYAFFSSILASKINFTEHASSVSNDNLKRLDKLFSPHDMKRLEAYTNNCADYHMVRVSQFLIHLITIFIWFHIQLFVLNLYLLHQIKFIDKPHFPKFWCYVIFSSNENRSLFVKFSQLFF